MRTLVTTLRPGGRFAFTAYGRRPWTKISPKYLLRPLTRRMNPATLLGIIRRGMPLLFPLTSALFPLPAIGRAAKLMIPVANHVELAELTREQRYDLAILDTFDVFAPRYDSPMTWQEMERALRQAGASRWEFRSRVPVVVGGAR